MNKPKTGIRRIAFFCLLLLPLSLQILAADESDPFYNELSFSLGADASGYSPTAFSLGGVFSADYRFLPFLAAGLNAGYGGDFDRLTNAGAQIFARWYFLQRPNPLNGMMFFAQIEGGLTGLWEKPAAGSAAAGVNRLTPAAGLGAGVRLKLPLNLYAEAYVRAGYPYIWGLSVKLGYTITLKPREQAAKEAAETPPQTPEAVEEEAAEISRGAVVDAPPQEEAPPSPQPAPPPPSTAMPSRSVASASQTTTVTRQPERTASQTPSSAPPPAAVQPAAPPRISVITPPVASGTVVTEIFGSIIFRGNGSDFTDLDSATVSANNEILDNVSDFLKQNPEYQLRIEGYANPVQTTAQAKAVEEQRFLQPISRERARAIMELLVDRGISRNRLTAVGLGGTKTVAAVNDRGNWDKNRRVEFMLIK